MAEVISDTSSTSRGIFFGWKVVATAFTVAVFAWGFGLYGPAVYLHALHDARGWSISVISAAITWQFVLSAGIVAYLSDIHRRLGVEVTTRAGVILLAAGTIAWSLADAPWQLFAAAPLMGAGWAMTSGAAINAMVSPWFERRRSAALSHALNGASVAGVLLTPIWIALIHGFGFPIAAAILGATMVLMVWPLAGRYLRPSPEGLGLRPDGGAASSMPCRGVETASAVRLPITLAALLRHSSFATMSAAFGLALFAQVGLLSHLVSFLIPALGDAGGAAAVSLTAACAVVGRLAFAVVPGDFDRRIVTALNLLLQVCGVVLLALGSSPATVLTGCVLFGLGVGNVISLAALVAQAEFDRIDVPRVVALATAINQALFAFAPGVFGALRDLMGSYTLLIAFAAALQFAAALLILTGRTATRRAPARVRP
ncbi:MAG TPA: MFS transporter [Stellaceae bacterium]|nr:MFS transporter [Stellaceae bacterium]